MGCRRGVPGGPGKRIVDWELEDPKGKDIETVRRIVDDIDGPGPRSARRAGRPAGS
jgi:hypothetical protein